MLLCTIDSYAHDALAVQAAAARLGVRLELLLLNPERFRSEERLAADLLLFGLMLDNDAELRILDLYHSMREHAGPAAAVLLEQAIRSAAAAGSREERIGVMKKAEQRLASLGLFRVLYRRSLHVSFHRSVLGIGDLSEGWISFKDIWLRSSAKDR